MSARISPVAWYGSSAEHLNKLSELIPDDVSVDFLKYAVGSVIRSINQCDHAELLASGWELYVALQTVEEVTAKRSLPYHEGKSDPVLWQNVSALLDAIRNNAQRDVENTAELVCKCRVPSPAPST